MQSRALKRQSRTVLICGTLLLSFSLIGCSKMQSAHALVLEARQYYDKGDNKAAVIQLKNALQKNPDDKDARLLLGVVYNEMGDPLSAEKEFRKALSLGVAGAEVHAGLVKALMTQGQYQKVLDETKNDVAGSDAELLSFRGNALLALGQAAEARSLFERVLRDKPDFPPALIGLSRHAAAQNDMEGATRFAEQAVAANPKDSDSWLFKGDLLRAQGKVEPALAAYEQVLKLKPGDPYAHLVKASLEISAKRFDAARADIDVAKKSASMPLLASYTQALLSYAEGKPAAALESLQQVLRAAPEHMPSVLLAGAVQLALGSTQQAEQHLKKYLEQRPGNPYASKLLATALLKNGDTARAISTVNAALKESPEDVQLLSLAGESYMKAKDFDKATKYYERASALAPKAAAIHAALGMSNLARGEHGRAIAELETAAGLDTKSSQSGILLAMTHVRLKNYDKALSTLKTLEKDQPDNPLIQNLKGGVYLAQNDAKSARASFEKALALQPAYFPAAANLAQLDLQEKKPDAAKKRFETLLEKDKKNYQAMASLAGLALIRGQKQEATDWLERAVKENPDELQPVLQLAAHYLRNKEGQKALAIMQKQQVLHPADPAVLDLMAQSQLATGDKAGALASYEKLATVTPTSPVPQFRIASTYMAMQNEAAAMESLKKALSIQPDYLDAQLAQAALEVKSKRYDQAIAIARDIQKQRVKSSLGFLLEGDFLMAQDKPALAATAFERAFAVEKSTRVMVKLHESLKKAGNEKQAEARLAQWLKEHPNDNGARMHIALASLTSGENKTAIKHLQAVLEQDPKNVPALNNLALAYQQEKDPRAVEFAEKALRGEPDNPAILDTAGWILVEQGNTTRGVPLLQKAVSLAPKAATIRYHLAVGLAKTGDKAKARTELEQSLATGTPFPEIDQARALLKQL